jgi:2-succinyl-5-enolpyruvyl-6-hydroxy-3-cyclohexene-1-carboxylate synthase
VSVPTGDAQATFAATLVDEWIRAGVRHAVVSPGSRSTPLVLALAGRDEIELHVRLDERGACFYAIGLSLATGKPTVVCTTSGTAATELHPGVVEASYAGVPLIVCTADRPPRLHHVGSPQTIEQANLFGGAVRSFLESSVVEPSESARWRPLGARAVTDASTLAGPVHLNLAFDEPLLGTAGPLPPGRPGGGPWELVASEAAASGRAEVRPPGRSGVIVAGTGSPDPGLVLEVADHLGWPVLADPRSGVRVEHQAVIATADAILRDPTVRAALAPDTVVLLGRPWASRVVTEFIGAAGGAGADIVATEPAAWVDPDGVAHEVGPVEGDGYLDTLRRAPVTGSSSWRATWERVEAAAQGAIEKALANDPLTAGGRTTEPGTLRHLFAVLDASTTLFVSSSMPVRDLEWYGAPRTDPPRVLSNRGVNGIDGVTSTALGVAAGQERPVVVVLGDLAFLHDASALVSLADDDAAGSCTLVVLDNGGGGIFSFLPQAGALDRERFERLFGTEPKVSVCEVARGFGLPVADVSTLGALDDALLDFVGREPRSVIRVALPSRQDNVGLHDRIHAAVTEATRSALAG